MCGGGGGCVAGGSGHRDEGRVGTVGARDGEMCGVGVSVGVDEGGYYES